MQLDREISEAILSATTARGSEKSICPSEIARVLYPDDWRKYMKDIVEVAIELQHQGKVIITQNGEAVDIAHIKGPIRIKSR
ncbi:DUF3253 domain-containing protein [Sphingobacterium sp. lm-10]|uniref:DUF3253 domain-containing protein n=1 Tax=Sphingobacterium sp. lm-10 TaxID=2944904 RepID=UPI00202113EE|nr:DUF3253 domain-containing protein [Sphingobacterium sp. lm-10]MCL7987111.1 DUF3253 domain-containing protein [Sphingobacterium sp. lm-10]